MSQVILPYYHPTTICFVDDNESFLDSLELGLPENFHYITFSSAIDALDYINENSQIESLADRCVGPNNEGESHMSVNLQVLEQEIARKERFTDLSVLLLDYAMPGLNGLEFCQQVKNKDLQIALLTGAANETTAVSAFNEGLINRYIRKGDLNTWDNIGEVIEQMKYQYFLKNSASIFSDRQNNPIAFRNIPALADFFRQTLKRYQIVEYYLTANPMGYLMLRADGNICRMVVVNDYERDLQMQLAQNYHAPRSIQRKLQSGKYIGYFFEHPQDYADENYPWQEMVLPAQSFTWHPSAEQPRQTWYAGIVEDPPVDIDFDRQSCTYDAYCAMKDTG